MFLLKDLVGLKWFFFRQGEGLKGYQEEGEGESQLTKYMSEGKGYL